jgi:integrase
VGYAEKRGTGDSAYWRGRYKLAPGRYGTVSDPDGSVRKYARKLDAKRAADAEETEQGTAARQATAATAAGRILFTDYVNGWFADLDLDEDTLATYGSIIACHFLEWFDGSWLDEITRKDIDDWEADQRQRGYKARGILNRRTLLTMILADAVADPAVTLTVNPAARRRGRGRRAEPPGPDDDEDDDEEEDSFAGKPITTPLGALLLAERCALMSGRDDEFVAVMLGYYTGLRWGELAGLETRFVRPAVIRIRWQLRERTGGHIRKRPKFGKVREADIPPWLGHLLAAHIARTAPRPCACHDRTYLFSGTGRARGTRQAVTAAAVAARAGVSQATVSAALNRPATVAAATRARIEQAITDTGYSSTPAAASKPPHWYRSGFGQWIWTPAVSGWYPERKPDPRRPVPVGGPWPCLPVRGRGNARRAEASWLPIAEGMTPHGLRHSHKSLMAELRTPEVLSHDRLGHELPGIAGIYSHPTPPMRAELMTALTGCWEKSLDDRLALAGGSPVAVLDRLLAARAVSFSPRILPDDLGVGVLRAV